VIGLLIPFSSRGTGSKEMDSAHSTHCCEAGGDGNSCWKIRGAGADVGGEHSGDGARLLLVMVYVKHSLEGSDAQCSWRCISSG